MNALATIAPAAKDTFLSLDGNTTVEVRHASHPEAVKSFDTDQLRRHFLVESLFRPGSVTLTYSHIDRFVVGGAMPVSAPLPWQALKPIGSDKFLHRRELGLLNVGGSGRVTVDGKSFDIAKLDALYVAMGAEDIRFDLQTETRVFHFMGEPAETRHLVVANEQAVLSPGWSLHSGVGTSNYTFVWAMAGDNQDFADMDALKIVIGRRVA